MMFDIPRGPDGLTKPLTPRQEEVTQLAARGLTIPEIAEALELVPDSVHMHVNAIADKLPNPHKLTPMKLVRQWAIAREFNRQGREPILLAPGDEKEIEVQTGEGRSAVVRITVSSVGQVSADVSVPPSK